MKHLFFVLFFIVLSVVNLTAAQTNEVIAGSSNDVKRTTADDAKKIDFRNFSYPYRFSSGRRMNLSLKNGKYEYDFKDDRGWSDFSNVYFVDLTNDRQSEAFVMLWHVGCGVSCDGGSALFYVYSFDKRSVKLLWEYETGSLAYGCGLKSLSVEGTNITVELFGRCNGKQESSSSTGKFQVKDVTRLIFASKGGKIVARQRTFISAPERSVINYRPQINLPR